MTGDATEWVDIVDDDDVVVRVTSRAEMRRDNLLHRAVFVLVWASDGRVLIHKRSGAKDVWPGQWDFVVGGVVTAGEGYDQAVRRELAEEIGIGGVEPVVIGHGRFEDDDVRLLARLYEVVHDGPYEFADGEVVEAHLVELTELFERMRTDAFVPDSEALLLAHLRRL